MTTVSWACYKAELKTPTPEDRRADRPTDRLAITGYWRLEAARTKPSYPVLIWTEPGKEEIATIFQIGRQVRNTVDDAEQWDEFVHGAWLHCVAVTKEDYAAALKTGFWPGDNKPATQLTDEQKLGIDIETGGNNPPLDESLADQIAALVAKIEGEKADKSDAFKVTDKATADTASGHLDKLRKLLELATVAFDAEKAPFLEGGRKVDAKWHGIRDPGIAAGARLKAARDLWLKNEQARLDAIAAEENRKAAAAAEAENRRRREEADALAAAETERLRKETEAAGQQVDEAEIAARVAETAPPVVEVKPVVVEPEKAKASSTYGRATSAKKVKVVTVTDPAVLCNHFLDSRGPDADFLAYLKTRAEKAVKAKITLPGVTVEEQ